VSMSRAALTVALGLAALAAGVAGCIGEEDELEAANAPDDPTAHVAVVDADGDPVPGADASVLDGEGQPLRLGTADGEGLLDRTLLAGPGERLLVDGGANGSFGGPLDEVGDVVQLDPPPEPATGGEEPVVGFEEPIRLGTAYNLGNRASCEVNNCGASEPVLETAADGTVYVSGTCCIGESPPIWVSRNGGESFKRLEGDLLRESFGIEGDFSIDDAGNMYFTDISAGSAYISSWGPDGEHRHTIPAGPFVPLVDRPWTLAGEEDLVHFIYNTGATTMHYRSTDGGVTWTPQHMFDSGLGTPGQGPDRDTLWVAAGGQLHTSPDGGDSWETVGEIPRPTDEGSTFQPFEVPVVDEAGNTWVVYDWSGEDQYAYHVYAALWDGEAFHDPVQVSPDEGTHHLPWAAAGAEGTLALAWYGTPDDEAGPNDVDEDARWYLHTAVSVDAGDGEPTFQVDRPDPELVHEGPMNRDLLDFLQLDIGPEGRLHVAYAQDRAGQVDEVTEYVRSTGGLDLAPGSFLNGPDDA